VYTCERCGTSFGRQTPVVESCPRCLARDGTRVALTFKLFKDVPQETTATPIPLHPRTARAGSGLEAAVRRELASGNRVA
jgi:hypothetical protein